MTVTLISMGHEWVSENKAPEDFLDFATAHFGAHPTATIYHDNHCEVTPARCQVCRHATREAAADDLLRRSSSDLSLKAP